MPFLEFCRAKAITRTTLYKWIKSGYVDNVKRGFANFIIMNPKAISIKKGD